MAKTIIRAHMKQRRDTAVNWQAQNPILLDGEIGIVTDQPDRYKVGDGVTEWNALPLRGFDGNIVQMTGDSRTAVMSQWAVTQALEEAANNALSPEKIKELTKDLASKDEVSTAIEALTAEVVDNEEVTAAALNDLNERVRAIPTSIDAELSEISTNPVQNKAITTKLNEKQDALVSGTSIKTINGQSLLGEGNLEVVTDLSAMATKAELQDLSDVVTNAKAELQGSLEPLITEIVTNEEVTAAALNDLNDRVNAIIARLDALSA